MLGLPLNGQGYQEIHNDRKIKQKCPRIRVHPSTLFYENDLQKANWTEGDKLSILQHIGGAVVLI